MTTNPFDDATSKFHVLVNDRGQYSLWPEFAPVPDGWATRLTSVTRDDATTYIELHWTGLQPARSLTSGESRSVVK